MSECQLDGDHAIYYVLYIWMIYFKMLNIYFNCHKF